MIFEAFLGAVGWTYLSELFKADGQKRVFDPAKAVGGVLASITGSVLGSKSEKVLDTFSKKLKGKPLPANKALRTAMQVALFASGREAALYCRQKNLAETGREKDVLHKIAAHLLDEIRKIKNDADRPGPTLSKETVNYLQMSKFEEENEVTGVDQCISFLYTALENELKPVLYAAFESDIIPNCYRESIVNGPQENGNGFNFLGFLCDYFNALLTVNPSIAEFIKSQWLARLTNDVDVVNAGLEKFSDILANIGQRSLEQAGVLKDVLQFVNPQPFLKYDFSDQGLAQKTGFKTRYLPFFGRRTELKELEGFFTNNEKFSWWLLIGQGGAGKSRMAMELCFELSKSYNVYAGFIDRDNIQKDVFNELAWQPECKTLIVVDYASLNYERLLVIIKNLRNRKEALRYPVRLLLLERELNGIWWDEFEKNYSNSEDIPKPWKAPLCVGELSDDDLWHIFEYTLIEHQRAIPDKKETLTDFFSIDNQKRPLFALFAALALANGFHIKGWDKVKLIQQFLQREEDKIWLPVCKDKEILKKHKALAALITISGGYDQKDLDELWKKKYDWLPTKAEFSIELFELISKIIFEDKYQFKAIEPDILGEYFVIEQLTPGKKDIIKDQVYNKTLIREAWETKIFETIFFTLRSFQDFYDHEQVGLLLEVLEAFDLRVYKNWLQILMIDIIETYCKNGQITKALELFNKIVPIDKAQNKNDFHVRQAKAFANIARHASVLSSYEQVQLTRMANEVLVRNRTAEMRYAKGLLLYSIVLSEMLLVRQNKSFRWARFLRTGILQAIGDLENWTDLNPTDELVFLTTHAYASAYALPQDRDGFDDGGEIFDRFLKFSSNHPYQVVHAELIGAALLRMDRLTNTTMVYHHIRPLFSGKYDIDRLLNILNNVKVFINSFEGFEGDELFRIQFFKDCDSLVRQSSEMQVITLWQDILLMALRIDIVASYAIPKLQALIKISNSLELSEDFITAYRRFRERLYRYADLRVASAFKELNEAIPETASYEMQRLLATSATLFIFKTGELLGFRKVMEYLHPYFMKRLDEKSSIMQFESVIEILNAVQHRGSAYWEIFEEIFDKYLLVMIEWIDSKAYWHKIMDLLSWLIGSMQMRGVDATKKIKLHREVEAKLS